VTSIGILIQRLLNPERQDLGSHRRFVEKMPDLALTDRFDWRIPGLSAWRPFSVWRTPALFYNPRDFIT